MTLEKAHKIADILKADRACHLAYIIVAAGKVLLRDEKADSVTVLHCRFPKHLAEATAKIRRAHACDARERSNVKILCVALIHMHLGAQKSAAASALSFVRFLLQHTKDLIEQALTAQLKPDRARTPALTNSKEKARYYILLGEGELAV